MCTAINLRKNNHYFGRNLDLEYHYNEEIVITPANFPFHFRNANDCKEKYPICGIATVINEFPLYYDAVNIFGLAIAGLNFPQHAVYNEPKQDMLNVASFELIPWILRQCKTVQEARSVLRETNITNTSFCEDMPATDLHWILSDAKESIAVEPTVNGLTIYDNQVDILTNNPPFPYQIYNLCNYLNLTNREPTGDLKKSFDLYPYSNGMGGFGLPGDLSSTSRFAKTAFMLSNSICDDTEHSCVSQFFHILDSVSHIRGSVIVNNKYEITYYTCCCNATKGIYYYKTYDNSRITAVDMHKCDLNGEDMSRYPLMTQQDIFHANH